MNKRFFRVSILIFILSSISFETPISAWSSETQQVAPGVFFRLSDSGCNNGWIEFKDYILVIDGNFPNAAEETLLEVQKQTQKPIRFVFDTHFHDDHIFGNAIFTHQGAAVISHQDYLTIDRQRLQDSFQNWIKNHPDYANLEFAEPSIFFQDRLILNDGQRPVELLSYKSGHSPGDAVAWLPKEKILFTGDLCVNGVFNYLGQSNLDQWIAILEMLQGLDVETVCPGHGPMAGKELLQTQKDYLIELRDQVQEGIDSGKTLEEIVQNIQLPVFQKWTGQPLNDRNILDAYRILTGMAPSWDLLELGLEEGSPHVKESTDWTPPKKILLRWLDDKQIVALKRVAPDVEFVRVNSDDEVMAQIGDADGVVGVLSPELFQAAKKLRWVHTPSAGVENFMFPDFVNSDIVLTNGKGTHGPSIADHVLGYMLMLSKGQIERYENKLQGKWNRSSHFNLQELKGKTILILGFGGIGSQIAQRAAGFGMTIIAVDPQKMEKPQYVQKIVPPEGMQDLLPQADFVASTVPLTQHTFRYFDKNCFSRMKPTAYFINIGRGQTVNQDDLVQALQDKTIAGAALDVTDPEPLPADSPLWKMNNVIITPHVSAHSSETWERAWLLTRENIRRFVQGQPLLNVVNKKAGY